MLCPPQPQDILNTSRPPDTVPILQGFLSFMKLSNHSNILYVEFKNIGVKAYKTLIFT